MNKRKSIRCSLFVKMKKNICNYILLGSVAAPFSIPALAQENPAPTPSREFKESTRPGKYGWETEVNSGYVGGTSARFLGTQMGNSDAFNIKVKAGARIPLNDDWFLKLGLDSDNYFLGSVAGEPLPDAIHTLSLDTGVGYHWNDRWTFTVMLAPSLYRFDDVNGSDFGISGGIIATFKQRPSLTWTFGMDVSPDGDVPVFPILGVRWLINEKYTLDLGVPKTRLSYRLDPNWTVYGGVDLVGTTFRASKDLGTKIGLPQYNNALGNYHDVRLGVGTSYEFRRGFRVEVDTGWSVYRQINYQRINQSIDFKPAPYVRLGLGARF